MPNITIDGVTKPLKTWTRDPRCNVHYATVQGRIERGWPVEEALFSAPVSSTEAGRRGKVASGNRVPMVGRRSRK